MSLRLSSKAIEVTDFGVETSVKSLHQLGIEDKLNEVLIIEMITSVRAAVPSIRRDKVRLSGPVPVKILGLWVA